MTGIRSAPFGIASWLALTALLAGAATGQGLPEVDPAKLAKDNSLIGRAISVDDRVDGATRFNRGRGFNEMRLRRAPAVIFRLPAKHATAKPAEYPAVKVSGLLRRDGAQLVFDVTEMEVMPDDRTRVEQAVSRLASGDIGGRTQWAEWAIARGRAFQDRDLERVGQELEAEAIRLEASRPGLMSPSETLALARKGRERGLPGPVPAALAHRAFRGLSGKASGVKELEKLVSDAEILLPKGKEPAPSVAAGEAAWLGRYEEDPYKAYLEAPADVQALLDRRLVTELTGRWLEARAAAEPSAALELAREAARRIPERGDLGRRIESIGLELARRSLETLERPTLESWARLLKDRGDQEQADELVRSWLRARQLSLGAQDAQGRADLARVYLEMTGDKVAAAQLLQEAIAVAPDFEQATEQLRRLGYRKVGNRWTSSGSSTAAAEPEGTTTTRVQAGLMNLTREEVRQRMGGNPERIIRSASQGQFVEQWVYPGPRGTQYINLLQPAGTAPARVVGHFSLP